MQEYKLSARGGIPTAIWGSLACLFLSVLVYVLFSTGGWVFYPAALVCLLVCVALPIYTSRFRVTISTAEVRVRYTALFQLTRRLPCRYITGGSILATPLQRALGVCCLFLYTPGHTCILIGIQRKAAEDIMAKLMEGGT